MKQSSATLVGEPAIACLARFSFHAVSASVLFVSMYCKPALFSYGTTINLLTFLISALAKRRRHTFMWTISATAHTTAPASLVWAIYCDVAHWPRWDPGLALYQPDGPFATGTSGKLQPVGGPELPFTLILVEEGRSFVDRTPVGPETAIIARHELTPLSGGTQITHIVEIDGPHAEHLAQEMGFTQEELYETVTALARYAEENPL